MPTLERTTLGISTLQDHFYWAVLSGGRQSPHLIDEHREPTPADKGDGALMEWFAVKFGNLIAQYQPSNGAFRLSISGPGRSQTREQMLRSVFPNAIFQLACETSPSRIPTQARTSQSLTLHALGLPTPHGQRGFAPVSAVCDQMFGVRDPYWDRGQKEAIVVAWLELA